MEPSNNAPEYSEVSAHWLAFLLTRHANSLSTKDIFLTSPVRTDLEPVIRASLLENPLTPGVVLYLEGAYHNHKVTGRTAPQYTLHIPHSHPLLQAIPLNCGYDQTPLPLDHTHTLLKSALRPFHIPHAHISAWPHPLTITLEPEWPSAPGIGGTPSRASAQLYHPYSIPWPQESGSTFQPSITAFHPPIPLEKLLQSTDTPPELFPPPKLADLVVNSFRMHALRPYLPADWYVVYVQDLDPSLYPVNHFKLHLCENTNLPNPSLVYNDGLNCSLLYLPSYAAAPRSALFNTPLPEKTLLQLPILRPFEIFQQDNDEKPSNSLDQCLCSALKRLSDLAAHHDQQTFSC